MNLINAVDESMLNFIGTVKSMSEAEAIFYTELLGGLFVVIAAIIGLVATLRQIRIQFEHKVIHEGWKIVQEKLFKFSFLLSSHASKTQNLIFSLQQQDNPFFNGGSKEKYLDKIYENFSDSYMNLAKAHTAFLEAYESYEIIFIDLVELKRAFDKAYETVDVINHVDVSQAIFPRSFGKQDSTNLEEKNKILQKSFEELMDIQSLLQDFRIEMQNVTLGVILNRSLVSREPTVVTQKLTLEGITIYYPSFLSWMKAKIFNKTT